MKIHNFHHRWC